MSERNVRQISSKLTNKAVVELMNKLRVATPGSGSCIHRNGEEENGRKLPNSLIGINLVDYQKQPSEFVTDNLRPSDVREIYNETLVRRKDYSFSGNGYKIFGMPDEKGLCQARFITISRQGSYTDRSGKVISKTYPWKMEVKNGKGIKEKTPSGGSQMKGGSFQAEKSASINLSDGDMQDLFGQAVSFLNAWEAYHYPAFLSETEKILENEERIRKISKRESDLAVKGQKQQDQKKLSKEIAPKDKRKKMKMSFRSDFGECSNPELVYANVTCFAGERSQEGVMWFEKSKLKERLNEFRSAMKENKKVDVYFTTRNSAVFFVA